MKKKVVKILVPVLVFLLIAAIGVGVYFGMRPDKTDISNMEALEEAFYVQMQETAEVTGYHLQWSLSDDFSDESTDDVHTYNTESTITELEPEKEYFVRTRTFKDKNKITLYSPWSEAKSVVTKKKIPLERIDVTPTEVSILIDETAQLEIKLVPENTSYKEYKITSSDSSIATVDQNGLVKGIKEGQVKIVVKSVETDKSATVDITVKKPYVPTTGIKFTDKAGLTLDMSEPLQLHATVVPADATDNKIIWSVSDDSKATVDDKGVVKGIRPSEYVAVTAKTEDGKFSAKYELKITNDNGFLTKSDLDKLNLDGYDNLMIVAHPDDETLWGGAHLLNDRWLVVVLTNGFNADRKEDFYNVMNRTNDKHIILTYPDTKLDWYAADGGHRYETDEWTTAEKGMKADITLLMNYKKWDTIATHNPNGEYNKNHHKMTSAYVTQCWKNSNSSGTPLYYFGRYYGAYNTIPGEQISSEDLKVKRELIDLYLPIAQGAIDSFGHMIPYENWIRADEWE